MGGWGCTTGRSGPDCTVGPRSCPIAPSGPDRAPIAPSGPDRAPIAPSGPDQGEIALSLVALLYKAASSATPVVGMVPGRSARMGRVWCWGYRPRFRVRRLARSSGCWPHGCGCTGSSPGSAGSTPSACRRPGSDSLKARLKTASWEMLSFF